MEIDQVSGGFNFYIADDVTPKDVRFVVFPTRSGAPDPTDTEINDIATRLLASEFVTNTGFTHTPELQQIYSAEMRAL